MKFPRRQFRFSFGKGLVLFLFAFVILSRWIAPLHEKNDAFIHWSLRPFLSLSNSIWRPFDNAFNHYIFLRGLQKENQTLKSENADLKQKWLEAQSQLKTYSHSQEILSVWEKTSFHPKLAEVMNYDPLDPSSGIWINQGSEVAIAPGQVVVAEAGVVGVISKVFSKSAKVMPLISTQSAIDVEIYPSGARGILKGAEKKLLLDRRYWVTKMEYLGSSEKIEVGDSVMTSGLDKIFPKAMLIGKIASIQKDDKALFVSAEVLPEVDFSKLREVAILIP